MEACKQARFVKGKKRIGEIYNHKLAELEHGPSEAEKVTRAEELGITTWVHPAKQYDDLREMAERLLRPLAEESVLFIVEDSNGTKREVTRTLGQQMAEHKRLMKQSGEKLVVLYEQKSDIEKKILCKIAEILGEDEEESEEWREIVEEFEWRIDGLGEERCRFYEGGEREERIGEGEGVALDEEEGDCKA